MIDQPSAPFASMAPHPFRQISKHLHDCFTHNSFFQVLFLRRLRLLLPASLLRTRRVPFREGSNALGRLGGEVARKASSGARWEGSGRRWLGSCCSAAVIVRKGPGAVAERARGRSGPSSVHSAAVVEVCSPEGGAIAAIWMYVMAHSKDRICGGCESECWVVRIYRV